MAKFSPEQVSHLCALMAWNGKTFEEAKAFVINTPYEQLNNTTYAEDSINTSKNGISEVFVHLDKIEVTPENYLKVIQILEKIHDMWVEGNAKKITRDKAEDGSLYFGEKSKKQMFQHLPLALIGLSETAKDLMFLAPFLNEMGLQTGDMQLEPWGAFKPNKELEMAYKQYVKNFLETNNIKNKTDLTNWIKTTIENNNYAPLNKDASEMASARVDYLNNNIEILVGMVMKNNPILEEFLNGKEIEK